MRYIDRSPRNPQKIDEELAKVERDQLFAPQLMNIPPSPRPRPEPAIRSSPGPQRGREPYRVPAVVFPDGLSYDVLAAGRPLVLRGEELIDPENRVIDYVVGLATGQDWWLEAYDALAVQPLPSRTFLYPYVQPGDTLGFRDLLVTHDFRWALRPGRINRILSPDTAPRWQADGRGPMLFYPRKDV